MRGTRVFARRTEDEPCVAEVRAVGVRSALLQALSVLGRERLELLSRVLLEAAVRVQFSGELLEALLHLCLVQAAQEACV